MWPVQTAREIAVITEGVEQFSIQIVFEEAMAFAVRQPEVLVRRDHDVKWLFHTGPLIQELAVLVKNLDAAVVPVRNV